jgi:hypothetical protein
MVLSPQQVEEQAKPDKKELEKLVQRIDKELVQQRKNCHAGNFVGEISYEYFPNIYARTIIEEMYRDNGWLISEKQKIDDDELYMTFQRAPGYE